MFIKENLIIQKSEVSLKKKRKIPALKYIPCLNVDFITSICTKIQWHIYPLLKKVVLEITSYILLIQSTYYGSFLSTRRHGFWNLRPKCHNSLVDLPFGNVRACSNLLKNFQVTSACFTIRAHIIYFCPSFPPGGC